MKTCIVFTALATGELVFEGCRCSTTKFHWQVACQVDKKNRKMEKKNSVGVRCFSIVLMAVLQNAK